MSEFRSWDSLTELEQLACTHWDMYKDAHGFRPRDIDVSNWTVEDFHREFDRLGEIIDREEKERIESEHQAGLRFEAQVAEWIANGTVANREAAIEKFHELNETDGDESYLCFKLGLSYSYFRPRVGF